jgi:cytochrome oxidase Cu insertion factor (SCO1/SenC/PrrC family)
MVKGVYGQYARLGLYLTGSRNPWKGRDMRPYKAVLIGTTTLVFAVIAAFILYGDSGGGRGVAAIGGPFTLTDHTGAKRTDQNFRGKHMLVYFGYTFCPDVCPTALQVMTNAMDRMERDAEAKIIPVFITIDPERDTVKQLASYVDNFHPRLVGLTGTPEEIANAARAYRVYFGKSKETGGDVMDYLMDHSSIVFLMDPNGRYITHFTHAMQPEKMAAALTKKTGG